MQLVKVTPKETLSSKKYKMCSECPHWGNKTKQADSIEWCTLLRKKYSPISSACFLADMPEEEAKRLGLKELI